MFRQTEPDSGVHALHFIALHLADTIGAFQQVNIKQEIRKKQKETM